MNTLKYQELKPGVLYTCQVGNDKPIIFLFTGENQKCPGVNTLGKYKVDNFCTSGVLRFAPATEEDQQIFIRHMNGALEEEKNYLAGLSVDISQAAEVLAQKARRGLLRADLIRMDLSDPYEMEIIIKKTSK